VDYLPLSPNKFYRHHPKLDHASIYRRFRSRHARRNTPVADLLSLVLSLLLKQVNNGVPLGHRKKIDTENPV
jgi:hypothetical protein